MPVPMDVDADCLVVGGGAAGLTAATYLARTHRSVLVIDAGDSRLGWIRLSRNVPGHPDGIAGPALHDRLRRQATRHGVRLERGRVDDLAPIPGGFEAGGLRVRRVVLACGVADVLPPVDGLRAGIAAGAVRLCPICDGYEATGRAIGILGPPDRVDSEAAFMRTYSDRITRLGLPDAAGAAGVTAVEPIGEGVLVTRADGTTLTLDALYLATGLVPRSDLAVRLGARIADSGSIETDAHQRTTVPGLWAIGDLVHQLNQIAVAFGHAAIAATDVHNDLTREDRAGE